MGVRGWTGLSISKLFPVWFVILVAAAIINLLFLRPTGIKLIDYYFNDFVSIPLMLHSTSIIMGFIYGKIPYYLSINKIVLAVIATGIAFEFALPNMGFHEFSDPWDVFVYSVGGLMFYLIQMRNRSNLIKGRGH